MIAGGGQFSPTWHAMVESCPMHHKQGQKKDQEESIRREKPLATSPPKNTVQNVLKKRGKGCLAHQRQVTFSTLLWQSNVALPLLSMHVAAGCLGWAQPALEGFPPPSLTLFVSPAKLLACSSFHQCDTQRLQRRKDHDIHRTEAKQSCNQQKYLQ